MIKTKGYLNFPSSIEVGFTSKVISADSSSFEHCNVVSIIADTSCGGARLGVPESMKICQK